MGIPLQSYLILFCVFVILQSKRPLNFGPCFFKFQCPDRSVMAVWMSLHANKSFRLLPHHDGIIMWNQCTRLSGRPEVMHLYLSGRQEYILIYAMLLSYKFGLWGSHTISNILLPPFQNTCCGFIYELKP